jgi:hypothetical protein
MRLLLNMNIHHTSIKEFEASQSLYGQLRFAEKIVHTLESGIQNYHGFLEVFGLEGLRLPLEPELDSIHRAIFDCHTNNHLLSDAMNGERTFEQIVETELLRYNRQTTLREQIYGPALFQLVNPNLSHGVVPLSERLQEQAKYIGKRMQELHLISLN